MRIKYNSLTHLNNQSQNIFHNQTINENLTINGNNNVVENDLTIFSNVDVSMLFTVQNEVNSEKIIVNNTTKQNNDINVLTIGGHSNDSDYIKIDNPVVDIYQKNQLQEIGFEIKRNKTQKFVWNSTDNQFYLKDEDDQLLDFKFQQESLNHTFLNKNGDTMEGELILFGHPTNELHQVTKGYVESKSNQNSPIQTHHHDTFYLKNTGGVMTNNTMLNLLYPIDFENPDHNLYQVNRIISDTLTEYHDHDDLYLKRTGGVLFNNLEVNSKQYLNLFSIQPNEEMRVQTKFDVDMMQTTIVEYDHTNYFRKRKEGTDGDFQEYNGQIFLEKEPSHDLDFVNKGYINAITGQDSEGLLYMSWVDIDLNWVSWMYEYSFDFSNWYNEYVSKLDTNIYPNGVSKDQFIVVPIVTFKTMRFTNKPYSSIGFRGNGGTGSGTNDLVDYKICPPHYYEKIGSTTTRYKFKVRLGQFGFNPILRSGGQTSYTQSNTTSGFVNYRVYFIGGPQVMLWELWNNDTNDVGNLRKTGSPKYGSLTPINSLLHPIEFDNYNSFNPDFCNYSISI